ncbi:hypothetical protein Peur_069411 [Populus x canadensis]
MISLHSCFEVFSPSTCHHIISLGKIRFLLSQYICITWLFRHSMSFIFLPFVFLLKEVKANKEC